MGELSLLKKAQKECKELDLLYVEDDITLSEATSKTLEAFFKSITIAYDGEEGLEKYKSGRFDIVITDILMPHLDGKEMSRIIRQINPEQAIIIMSAHEESTHLMELIEIGIYKFIPKPPNLQHMIECIYATAVNINNAKKVALMTDTVKQDLAESQTLLRTIIDTVPVRIFWKDKDSNYLGCNTLFAS